jgi:hypothetical protein
VALAGDTDADGYGEVVVGAPRDVMEEGRAYVYAGSASGLSGSPLVLSIGQAGAHFGAAVGTAGDANGDGIADILIAAPDHGAGDEGWVGLYLGSHAGLATVAIWTTTGSQAGARLGVGLATAGDVDGDGRSDVLAGAPGYDGDQPDEGRATLFLGKSGVLGSNVPSPGGSFAGDVNGDGYSDAIRGDPSFDGTQVNQGRVQVWGGSSTGLEATPLAEITLRMANLFLGQSVSTAGDINGDGYDDIVYGAVQRTLVSLGSPSGPPDTFDWQRIGGASSGAGVGSAGDQNGDGFGDFFSTNWGHCPSILQIFWCSQDGPPNNPNIVLGVPADVGNSASSAGDINRDGYTDFLISYWTNTLYNTGEFRIYKGGTGGLSLFATIDNNTQDCDNFLGGAPSWVGDVNRDGKSDTAVNEFDNYNCGGPDQVPRTHVYFNFPSSRWTVLNLQPARRVGDVNADGYSDVVIGSQLYLGSASGPIASGTGASAFSGGGDVNGDGYADVLGTSTVRFGGGSRGVSYAPRQMRPDLSAPVALLGSSGANSIALAANGRSAVGRRSVRMEWQMALLIDALESQPIDAGLAADSGPPTAEGSVVPLLGHAEHLEPGGNYHWRARIATDHPLFPRSIWFTLPNSNSSEQKFRVPPVHADEPVGETPLRIR